MGRTPNIPIKEGNIEYIYYMFVEDADSSVASDNANTKIDLEILKYLKDEDDTLEFFNRYSNVKISSLNITLAYQVLLLLNDYCRLVE